MTPAAYRYTNAPDADTKTAFLLTGGNLGDRPALLALARARIDACCGRVTRTSSLYETAAWGMEDQPPFLNQVLELQTTLPAERLMDALLSVEKELGRIREGRYGPRLIDIDILFYDSEVIATEGLTIPHPRMADRRFVLEPLHELIPGFVHPVLQRTIREILDDCTDPLAVHKFS